jgi:hypothetical protein
VLAPQREARRLFDFIGVDKREDLVEMATELALQ